MAEDDNSYGNKDSCVVYNNLNQILFIDMHDDTYIYKQRIVLER